jgi:hypothetical protein
MTDNNKKFTRELIDELLHYYRDRHESNGVDHYYINDEGCFDFALYIAGAPAKNEQIVEFIDTLYPKESATSSDGDEVN